jgi:hypothetical protein
MGDWSIDTKSSPGLLILRMSGAFSAGEMAEVVRAHNAAIDALGDATYRVFVDLRNALPLSPEAASQVELAKAYSASRKNFQGSAVLVASSVVAMQNRRTTSAVGALSTELISDDEAACMEHLRQVRRERSASQKTPSSIA